MSRRNQHPDGLHKLRKQTGKDRVVYSFNVPREVLRQGVDPDLRYRCYLAASGEIVFQPLVTSQDLYRYFPGLRIRKTRGKTTTPKYSVGVPTAVADEFPDSGPGNFFHLTVVRDPKHPTRAPFLVYRPDLPKPPPALHG